MTAKKATEKKAAPKVESRDEKIVRLGKEVAMWRAFIKYCKPGRSINEVSGYYGGLYGMLRRDDESSPGWLTTVMDDKSAEDWKKFAQHMLDSNERELQIVVCGCPV